jgi:hypothetical protein
MSKQEDKALRDRMSAAQRREFNRLRKEARPRGEEERAANDLRATDLAEDEPYNLGAREVSAPPPAPSWLGSLLQGLTLVSVVAAAFWLGSLSNKLSETSAKTDRLYSVVLESRDSISARMSAMEAKLDSIDKKLDEMARPNRRDTQGD